MRYIAYFILFILLTILTQIGGVVLLLSLLITKRIKQSWRWKSTTIFAVGYLFATLVITPIVAPLFGRETIEHAQGIRPTNYGTVLLNRNYVTPALNDLLQSTASRLTDQGLQLRYLDANFPFIDQFPLLPHLSHDDGEKVDLSFVYENSKGELTDQQKSVSGYGVYTEPRGDEFNQIERCVEQGYWQYDFPKYLTLGTINTDLQFSDRGNLILIKALLAEPNLGKLFIEPHLEQRLGLKHPKVRYHGCRAVRHDDHIHLQLK